MNHSFHAAGPATARALVPPVAPDSVGSRGSAPSLRRVPVTWQDSSWRVQVTVAGRKLRLKPHHTLFTRRAARLAHQVSRNGKHLLRHIIL
jgi:hypothetical protein